MEICQKFGKENDLIFNSKKSAILPFMPDDKKKLRIPRFYLDKESVPIVGNFEYLGHILSKDGTDDLDIERQRKKIYATGNSLLRIFHMCSVDVKMTLSSSYCTPLYTAHLWTNYYNKTLSNF